MRRSGGGGAGWGERKLVLILLYEYIILVRINSNYFFFRLAFGAATSSPFAPPLAPFSAAVFSPFAPPFAGFGAGSPFSAVFTFALPPPSRPTSRACPIVPFHLNNGRFRP